MQPHPLVLARVPGWHLAVSKGLCSDECNACKAQPQAQGSSARGRDLPCHLNSEQRQLENQLSGEFALKTTPLGVAVGPDWKCTIAPANQETQPHA